jgi:hypothetical protein
MPTRKSDEPKENKRNDAHLCVDRVCHPGLNNAAEDERMYAASTFTEYVDFYLCSFNTHMPNSLVIHVVDDANNLGC